MTAKGRLPQSPRNGTHAVRGSTGAKAGTYPAWCRSQGGSDCNTKNPLHLSTTKYQSNYQGNLATVGQALTAPGTGTGSD